MKRKAAGVVLVLAAFSAVLFLPLAEHKEDNGSRTLTGLLVATRIAEYEARVSVFNASDSRKIGVSADYGRLDFGRLPLHSTATRYINLSAKERVKVAISADGGISRMLRFGKNNFVLQGNEKIPLILSADRTGNFSGKVFISIKKPRYEWLSWVVPWL